MTAATTSDEGPRLLARPRAMAVFALIVFCACALQVASAPILLLWDAGVEWNEPLPLALVIALVVAGCALQAASLLLSSRFPVAAVAIATACYLALAIGLNVPNWLTPLPFVVGIAVFLLAAHRPSAVSVGVSIVTVVIVITALTGWALSLGAPLAAVSGFLVEQALAFAAPVAGATALGIWWRRRIDRLRHDRERLAEAARRHEQEVRDARAHERARIAQELHDVAGQHLAGLMSLADAAVDIDIDDPGEAIALIEDIRTEGRFASASLYAALRDLRAENDATAEPTPDLHDIDTLVAFWRARGMRIEVHASEKSDDLPAMVSTTAYRVVQEALTNASKHAPGARVTVETTVTDAAVRVAVRNDAYHGDRTPVTAAGLGWGLRGLGERADLLRAVFAAGPTTDGGWAVLLDAPVLEVDTAGVPSP